MAGPASKLFYKIGEVSRLAGVEVYVLRYWESEFRQLSPRKNRGGQRVYTQRDLGLVLRLKRMLHVEGYTIAGARKRLIEEAAAWGQDKGGREPKEEAGAAMVRANDYASRHSRESGNPVAFSSGPDNEDKKLADTLGSLKDELKDILKIIKQD